MAGTGGSITLPAGFDLRAVDSKFRVSQGQHVAQKALSTQSEETSGDLGILSSFAGAFSGNGFNTIFRPANQNSNTDSFVNKSFAPLLGTKPNESILELNLTQESLSFACPLGRVPNRGLSQQDDLTLNGVPYVQVIDDISNPKTGKADGPATNIHFEPGLWMHIPATTNNPGKPEMVNRMASIPHGTTINAEGLAAPVEVNGPPNIPSVDITPFVIVANGQAPVTRIRFASQTANITATPASAIPRIPQDLSLFIAASTITQEILDDPNTVLRNANVGKNIINTKTIAVSTVQEGGTANTDFLDGKPLQPGQASTNANDTHPNANAHGASMSATFWISTVEYEIVVPPSKPGPRPLVISPAPLKSGVKLPTFEVNPPKEIKTPTTIKVHATQIRKSSHPFCCFRNTSTYTAADPGISYGAEYSQLVNLNFAGLTWPHVSVATLVPVAPVKVPATAFN